MARAANNPTRDTGTSGVFFVDGKRYHTPWRNHGANDVPSRIARQPLRQRTSDALSRVGQGNHIVWRAFASRIVFQTRSGVAGMSMFSTPYSDSASTIAFIIE